MTEKYIRNVSCASCTSPRVSDSRRQSRSPDPRVDTPNESVCGKTSEKDEEGDGTYP